MRKFAAGFLTLLCICGLISIGIAETKIVEQVELGKKSWVVFRTSADDFFEEDLTLTILDSHRNIETVFTIDYDDSIFIGVTHGRHWLVGLEGQEQEFFIKGRADSENENAFIYTVSLEQNLPWGVTRGNGEVGIMHEKLILNEYEGITSKETNDREYSEELLLSYREEGGWFKSDWNNDGWVDNLEWKMVYNRNNGDIPTELDERVYEFKTLRKDEHGTRIERIHRETKKTEPKGID